MGGAWRDRLKRWATGLKRDVVALWFAARDRRTPWCAKVVAAAVAAYALSPIDLIPDFIPVLGYLDDVIIVPLGVLVAVRLIPAALMAELRLKALDRRRPRSVAGLMAILLIWSAALSLSAWAISGPYAHPAGPSVQIRAATPRKFAGSRRPIERDRCLERGMDALMFTRPTKVGRGERRA